MKKLSLAIFICVVFVLSGFAQKTYLPPERQTKRINAEGLKAILPNAENRKPLLINFWATWCGPCWSEFPELVKIDADYRKKGLNFSLVSVDSLALIDTQVPEFLQQFKATMPSYLIYVPNGRAGIAKAVRQIAPGFADRYPLTLLFDKNGKLVYQKMGRIDEKTLRIQLGKVLSK